MTDRKPPIGLLVEEQDRDAHCTLTLGGELDIASVPLLEGALERACTREIASLTLDLRQLMFVDSTGLAAIVLASKRCERNGLKFLLIRGTAGVQRLFELTGLADVLPFIDAGERLDGQQPSA